MRSFARLGLPVLLGAAWLAFSGCGRDQPTAPTSHTLSGPVVLTGYLVAPGGAFAGTKVVGDADGIVVELLYAGQVVGSATTVNGVYHFPNLTAGYYQTRTRVHGAVGDTTDALTVANQDVMVRDTLRVRSRGDLYPVPNPLYAIPNPSNNRNAIYFELPDSVGVDFEIWDLSGNVVRRLLQNAGLDAGLNAVYWDLRDQSGMTVQDSIYWSIFTSGGDQRAQLLFR